MENRESQTPNNLTETTNAAQPRFSQSGNGVHDTHSSSGTDEQPGLTNLAGELQDLIIINLHPSAAIALSQTNHHFHSCVSLHRLPFPVLLEYFQEKELLSTHSDDYACYTCLRLQPRSNFAWKQTRTPRGKTGKHAHKRVCLSCGIGTGKHTPGSMMKIGADLQVRCNSCKSLQKRFCRSCRWCDSCISKDAALPSTTGTCNHCENHDWVVPGAVGTGSKVPRTHRWATFGFEYGFEDDSGRSVTPEWLDYYSDGSNGSFL